LQEGLTLARQLGIPQITADTLYEYGNLYLDKLQQEAAELAFREMLVSVPEGGQELVARAQYGLARVAAAQGNIDEARRLGEASLMTLDVIGNYIASEERRWLNSIVE
jgi:tetratricopeptide (TPR) repeat protein